MRPDDLPTHQPATPDDDTPALRLSPEDAVMLDRLVDVDFQLASLGALSPEEHRRASAILAALRPLDAYAVDSESDAHTLVDATMARIARADQERSERLRIDAHPAYPRRRARLGDFVAVASVAILGISVLVPLANWANGRAAETRCANNLRLVASGLTTYAHDYGALPMAASLLPSKLDELAEWAGYRHSDNLKVLASNHYCGPDCLCCPGDKDPAGSYAYQVPSATRKPLWNVGPRTVLVGDRNPLVDLRRHGEAIRTVALNSASHDGRGQSLLFSDGSIEYSFSPYIEGEVVAADQAGADNFWLPFGNGPEALLGRPRPAVDVFLLH